MIKCFDNNDLKNPRREAVTFITMITILIGKFKEYKTNHCFMNNKMKKLILILELYSQNSTVLVALFYKLSNFNPQKNSQDSSMSGNFDLKHLIKISKQLKKPFSGRYLVNSIRKQPPDIRKKNFDKDSAVQYAQTLLEANYMTLVEIKSNL